MAELTKMLHFLKNGSDQTAKVYSTTDEAGDNYVQCKIDGVACYVPLGATDDTMATNGRVIKGGSAYAIKSQSKPPYTEISYTTAGTYTFTVPSGVNRMRVAVCGGGGGGAVTTSNNRNADSGGTSSFGNLISATGGGGGKTVYNGEEGTGYSGSAGQPNGNTGADANTGKNAWFNGGTGFALSFTKTSGVYGKGSGVFAYYPWRPGGTGGSGGYNTGYVSVTPNTTYTVTVGNVGKSNANMSSNIREGTSGFVLIAYGGDI